MKTKKEILHTFSGNKIDFKLPRSWQELNEEQLRYVFFAVSNFSAVTAKIYIFCRLLGIDVKLQDKGQNMWLCKVRISWRKSLRFLLHNWQLSCWIKQLDWIVQPSYVPVRLQWIRGREAIDPLLRGISFETYLCVENLYQGFLHKNDNALLMEMFSYLYVDKRTWWQKRLSRKPKEWELLSIFMWWGSIKHRFSYQFSHFFQKADTRANDNEDLPNQMAMMNAQIRALTGGDITKESEILNMDCWRALIELNEKARESQEWQRKYGRN